MHIRQMISVLWMVLWLLPVISNAATAHDHDFDVWLHQLSNDVVRDGILPRSNADQIFKSITFQPRIIDLDRRQPEHRLSTRTYLQRTISNQRIGDGKKYSIKYNSLLNNVERKYNVQGRFVLALWAMETNYGRLTGGFRVLDALATLAYEGRRAAFFRDEFLAALTILGTSGMKPDSMTGSWAGAMGQCQFMPSTFLKYAVDFNGDGHRDIWSSHADVLGSAAHYLHQLGWDNKRGWGRQVRIPTNLDHRLITIDTSKSLSEWQKIGVRRLDGHDLPKTSLSASLIQPDGPGTSAYLVYDNFKLLLKWNRSIPFALSVGILADHIG